MKVPADAPPEQRDEPGLAEPGDLADGGDARVVELPRRDRADAPEALDRERNFVRAWPRWRAASRKPDGLLVVPRRRSRTAISVGVPASRSMPRTSRNASSIESPSTSGVVSSNKR